jgi:hypothetical protein
MPVGEDHRLIGMDFTVLQSRHAMIHAPGQFTNFRVQRAAERHVHFLKAAADAEDRHTASDAGFGQRQCHVVAVLVVGFVPLVRLGLEAGRMDVGAGAGQHDTVDHIEQGSDIGDLGRAGKHQRQRARHIGDRTQVTFSDHLRRETIFDAMGVPDHPDHGPSHRQTSAVIVLCKDLLGWVTIPADHACEIVPDQHDMTAKDGLQPCETIGPAGPVRLLPRERLFGVNRLDAGQARRAQRRGCRIALSLQPRQLGRNPARDGSPSAPPKSSGQNPFGTTSAVIAPRR